MLLQTVGSGMSSLIMFGMIFAVMYFFMIRPQIKKQKKERQYRSALQKGTSQIFCGLTIVGAHQHNLRLSSSGAPFVQGGSRQYQLLPLLVELDNTHCLVKALYTGDLLPYIHSVV